MLTLLLAHLLCPTVHAQIVIDLQHEHTLRQVKASGVTLRSYDGDKGFYTMAPGNIILKLPGGQEIQSKITDGSLRARDDGVLTSLHLLGPILSDNEAYEVALKVHRAFGIPTNRLEHWKSAIVGKGRDAQGFSNGNKAYYPDFFIQMASSMNERYPWFMLIELGWNGLPGDDRDEAWGAANNPKPPPNLKRVSLDSPSGRTYDRKDAYVYLWKVQEHLANQWSVIVALIVATIGLLWMLAKRRKG
jgi:hypothetical protein